LPKAHKKYEYIIKLVK